MKTIFLWFKKQGKRLKDWWGNNQERVKDEVARVIAILAIIIFSPIIIIILIILLPTTIDIDSFRIRQTRLKLEEKIREFSKKFIKRLWEDTKRAAFYFNSGLFPSMSEEDREWILKLTNRKIDD